jgi:hypothetical protein
VDCVIASRRAVFISALVLALFAACGGGKKVESVTTSPSPATSAASATPTGSLTVVPPSGALGTLFTFKADGFQPGESVRFTVTRPAGTTFTGPPHVATAAGTVSAVYKPTAVGHYGIEAVGDKGGHASGALNVGPAPARTPVPHRAPVHTVAPKPAAKATATPYHY